MMYVVIIIIIAFFKYKKRSKKAKSDIPGGSLLLVEFINLLKQDFVIIMKTKRII